MNDPLPDKQVYLAIIAVLIIVFGLIFSIALNSTSIDPGIQWRDSVQSNTRI